MYVGFVLCIWTVFFVYVGFVLCIHVWINFEEGKEFMYEKSFKMCICLWQFDCPEVILRDWQDVKTQLLANEPVMQY